MKINEIVDLLTKASEAYYNSDKPIMTDAGFDRLKKELELYDPENPFLKQIGAPVKGNKVKLPFYMHSLDKIKIGEKSFYAFISPGGVYVVSEKLDGVSLLICENNGEWNIYSRGDGFYGGRLRFLEKVAKLPQPIKGVSIRAEAIVSKKVFEEKYIKKYENARNMVSGLLNPNRVSENEAIKDIEIIAYEVFSGTSAITPSQQFEFLAKEGFKTPVWWDFYGNYLVSLDEMLENWKKNSSFEIDGFVVTRNYPYERPTEGNPDYAKAFKMDSEDQTAIVQVIGIDWQVSRYGYLKPVILVTPTKLCGVTISKVSGHNAYFIENGHLKGEDKPSKRINLGAKLKIIRSGDVIPKVLEVVEVGRSLKDCLPSVDFEWNETEVDYILAGFDPDVEIKELTHFFKTIKADGIDIGLCTKFYENGLKTVYDVISAQKHRFLAIEGIQQKTASNIISNIGKALNGIDIATLMDASSCFGRAIGPKRIKAVLEVIPYEKLQYQGMEDISERVRCISGFDSATAQVFAAGMMKFKKFYDTVAVYVTIAKEEKPKVIGNKFSELRVLFTGFRDKELENYIIENGGKVASGIANANLLLVKDLNTTSSKMKQAIKKDIEIMSVADFKKMYELI